METGSDGRMVIHTGLRVAFSLACGLFLVACTDNESLSIEQKEATSVAGQPQGITQGGERSAFFGDLHVHSAHSFDAFVYGTTARPDDAYRFAKGDRLEHALGFEMRLQEPLDFLLGNGSRSFSWHRRSHVGSRK